MKRLFFSFVCLFVCTQLFADPVTAEQASRKASKFLTGRVTNKARRAPRSLDLQMASVGKDDSYYIFNIGQGEGFVIVSGEDATEEILGYSDTGRIDANDMPDNFKTWMEGYAKEIDFIRKHPELQRRFSAKEYPSIMLDESRLARFDQGEPYNSYCPDNMIVGCVPTAIAQLLYYHQYPAKLFNTIPKYRDDINSIKAGTAIDWTNIKRTTDEITNKDQVEAVSQLSLYCGVAIAASYKYNKDTGHSSTGADPEDIPYALCKYFGYSKDIEYYRRDNYTSEEWMEIVYCELAKNRPVLYAGRSASGGHCFLLEGYDSEEGKFYVNWGWNGHNNGFFLLTLLNGYSYSPVGYDSSQSVIVGVAPNGNAATYSARLNTTDIYMSDNNLELSRSSSDKNFPSFQVTVKAKNMNPLKLTFEQGVALFDSNQERITDIWWHKTHCWQFLLTNKLELSKGEEASQTYNVELGKELSDGVYYLCAVSKEEDADDSEYMANFDSDHYYLELTVSGNRLVAKEHNPDKVNLTLNSLTAKEGSVLKKYRTARFSVSLKNPGQQAYTGNVKLYQTTNVTKDSLVATAYTTLSAGETQNLELSFYAGSAGLEKFVLKDKRDRVLGSINVLFSDSQSLRATTSINNYDLGQKVISGTTLTGTATITNPDDADYGESVILFVFSKDGEDRHILEKKVYVPHNGSQTLDFFFDGLRVGVEYKMILSYMTNFLNNFYYVDFTCSASNLNVGDTFTSNTKEGVGVLYKVLNNDPMQVEVSCTADNDASIDMSTKGAVTIPQTVNGYTVVGVSKYAFSDCKSITKVTLPRTVTYLGMGAFSSCHALESIEGLDGVKSIGRMCISYCRSLKSLRLPETLTFIGAQGLRDNPLLTSIYIPKNVSEIEDNFVLAGDNGLVSIQVAPDNPYYNSGDDCNAIIETATNKLIAGCGTTRIPDNVTAIGDGAFNELTSLVEITIPASVRDFGYCAFEGCTNLEKIYSLSTEPFEFTEDAFKGYYDNADYIYNKAFLYIPDGTKDTYRSTQGWNKFAKMVESSENKSRNGDLNGDKLINVIDIVSVIDLMKSGKYNADADLDGDNKITQADIDAVTDGFMKQEVPNSKYAVDLGLSVKWAMMNVGAANPEDYGGYYAWAETNEKDSYSWDNYKYSNATGDEFSKYCMSSYYGTVDDLSTVEPMDDAARVNMGKYWRMPTKTEMDELVERCTWTEERLNGVDGYRVTGPNGKSIFLPFGGQKSGDSHYNRGGTGFYWVSTLSSTDAVPALYMYDGKTGYMNYMRKFGMSIRPVLKTIDEMDDLRMNDIVPSDMREGLRNHMPIYNGINPPSIEGVFYLSPYTTVYCEDGHYRVGQVIDSYKIKFLNQNFISNTIDMYEYDADSSTNDYDVGKGAFISGNGERFTAFFATEGYTKSIFNRMAVVISGRKTSEGIRDFYYGLLMVEKGPDPNHKLMDVGYFRIFKDGDTLSEPTTWNSNIVGSRQLTNEGNSSRGTIIDGEGK